MAIQRVLFVCMGNICRSPTAEGVFRHQVFQAGRDGQFVIDSAGTHNYHPGSPPDSRSIRIAATRGIDISGLRARQIGLEDFAEFDWILAMDWDNHALLEEMCPGPHQHKLRRLAEFSSVSGVEVIPDPYYDGDAAFEHVIDLVDDCCQGLLKALSTR
jgi:protein-tyrosine phosphatase